MEPNKVLSYETKLNNNKLLVYSYDSHDPNDDCYTEKLCQQCRSKNEITTITVQKPVCQKFYLFSSLFLVLCYRVDNGH
jgi:hypothetical protein